VLAPLSLTVTGSENENGTGRLSVLRVLLWIATDNTGELTNKLCNDDDEDDKSVSWARRASANTAIFTTASPEFKNSDGKVMNTPLGLDELPKLRLQLVPVQLMRYSAILAEGVSAVGE
jgi:hypothetical protein